MFGSNRYTTAIEWLIGECSRQAAIVAFGECTANIDDDRVNDRLDECALAELGEDAFLFYRTIGEYEDVW